MFSIDGVDYNIPVISLVRKADFLDKYAERTEDGNLHRELIGVYYNYQLKLGSSLNTVNYQALWLKLTEPVEFHDIIIVDSDGGEYTFTAYFSNVSDEYKRVIANPDFGNPGEEEYKSYFKNLTVNFIAKAPSRTP
jgi:hypothetical protein